MSDFSFGSIVPLVPAINLDEVVEFYVQELGFTQLSRFGDQAGLGRDGVEFYLYQTNDKYLADWSVIRLRTKNIEKLWEQLKDKKYIHPRGRLQLMDYGLMEFSLIDPSGVLVRFFEKP